MTDVVLTMTLSLPIPAGAYDGTKMCSVSSPALTASNIKNGATILGILGTYTGSGGGGGGGPGSNNISNNSIDQPDRYNDPINGPQMYNYCDSPTYHTTGKGPADKAASACPEDGENFFTTNDAQKGNAGKVALGYSSTPKVAWRLPNKYDYVQAEADDLRLLLPDNMNRISYNGEWPASVFSYYRDSAWIFFPCYGYF